MRNELLSSVRYAVKNWWISLIVGALAIILGIWCLASPLSTLIALSLVFAVTFIVSGLAEIVFALSNRKTINGWGWTLASGIVDLIFGIIIASMPIEIMALVLSYFVGFWILFRSIWGIGSAVELQKIGVTGWGWTLAFAILGIIASFICIISPAFTATFIVIFMSVGFIMYGLFRIILSFKLKSIKNSYDKLNEENKD